MLTKLKLLYPAINDEILGLLLDSAKQFILDYCGLDAYDEKFDSVLLRMIQEDVNQLYAEGYQSESAEGSSVSYSPDYSERVYRTLNRNKKVRVVR